MAQRPKLLCLHGGGASAAILKVQFAKLERALGTRFDLVYLNAPLDSAPGPGVLPFFEGHSEYSCWVSNKTLSSEAKRREEDAAIAYIKSFIIQRGPFAGVLGFSQGARAAASILVEQQERPFTHNALFGVFFCGTFPLFLPEPSKINLPTVHIHGLSDPYVGESEMLLSQCTQQSVRRVIKFEGGHHMPTSHDTTRQIADSVFAMYRVLNRKRVGLLQKPRAHEAMIEVKG